MRDVRYKIELEKLKKDIEFCNFDKVTLSSGIVGEIQLDSEFEKKIKIFRYRTYLKEIILFYKKYKNNGNKEINHVIKQYNDLLLIRREKYPRFIFDDYNLEIFENCLELLNEGKTLREVEDFYIKKYSKQKTL